MKPKANRFLALACLTAVIATCSASAATFAWNGSSSSAWSTAANWDSSSVAPTGAVTNHRVNIKGGSANEAVYDSLLGNSTYGGAAIKGLVIGNPGNATLRITGGKLTTQGTGNGTDGVDVVGNTNGTANLIIDGGEYQGCIPGTYLGLGGGPTSNFTVNSGTATVTLLYLNATNASVTLNGGLLVADRVWQASATYNTTVTFDGGTLRAGANAFTNFVSALDNLYVKAGGATIDSNGKNITITAPLTEDPLSTGGGLTKDGAGLLTLGAVSTITGDVTVNAGGISIKAAPSSWAPASFTHSGDSLTFDLGVFDGNNPPAIDVAELTLNENITVNISGSSIPVSGEIRILDYGTKSGSGSLTLNIASLPFNMVATLEENTLDGYYYLNVTSPSATSFTWSGDANADATGSWNTTSQNWNANAAVYAEPALATFPNIAGGGTVTIAENVSPLAISISNTAPNTYNFSGTGLITGTTGITKSGTGIAVFNGAAHSYGGNLAIDAGAVIKNVADATTGNISVAADNVSFVLRGGITDGAGQTLTISGRGATGADYFFAGSNVQRGALQAHSGASTWEGDIVLASNSTSVINRIGVQNGASLTLTGTISESVSGAPLLFRAGLVGNDITLGGTSSYTYTGQTQIFSNGGSIILGMDNKLPTTASVFFGSGGTTLFDMNGSDQEFAGINGNAFGAAATITNNGSGPSILTTNSPAESPTEAADYFPAIIADGTNSVSFVKNGDGTQVFAGNNSYSGTTTINAGRLELQENQSGTGDVIINGGNIKLSFARTLASGVNLSIASGAFFYLDGSSQTLGKLEGAGTIDFTYDIAGVDTLTVGANDTSSTFDGVIQQSQPRTYAFTKIGTGTFTLTGLNTYTGTTTVEDGTLVVAQPNFANASTVRIGLVESSPAVLHLPNAGTDIVTELIIDGLAQPGDGQVYDASNSDGAITGLGSIQVGTAPSGYASWVTANTVTEGENGDDDKDSISNLVEYALGLDPQVGDPAPGTFTGNTLTFVKGSLAKAAGDVTYQIETSSTLDIGSWSTAAAVETSDDISFLLPPGAPGGKIFGRLKVTKP